MTAPLNWRKHLPIHPAAELFPLMSEAELKELAEDIKNHGLQTPIVIWESPKPDEKYQGEKYQELLDGRNRLDALALIGLLCVDKDGVLCLNKRWRGHKWAARAHEIYVLQLKYREDGDPYALALSFNVHRRHLTTEQKRELIAKVLKAKPGASNRQVAEQVKADDKTVAKVRTELEATAEIPQLKKTTGKDGKSRPASKPKRPSKAVARDSFPTRAPSGNDVDTEASAEQRRTANAELESADDGDRRSTTEPDKKPNRTNRFANVANARKRAAATSVPLKEINAFHSEAVGFLQDFTQRLRAWCATRPPIDKDGKAALMQALYLCADGFTHLAQELDGRDDLSIPDVMRR